MSRARMSPYQGSKEQLLGGRGSVYVEFVVDYVGTNVFVAAPFLAPSPHLLEAALGQKVLLDRESSKVAGNAPAALGNSREVWSSSGIYLCICKLDGL